LSVPAGEKRIGMNQDRTGFLANDYFEGRIDLRAGAWLEHLDVLSGGSSGILNFFVYEIPSRVCRIHQNGNRGRLGCQHV
jgi:hypothetical protein